MPSSPEQVLTEPTVTLWMPRELTVTTTAVEDAPPKVRPWSFEAAFPDTPSGASVQPFTVPDQLAVPETVLSGARRAAQSAGYAAGYANGIAAGRAAAEQQAAVEAGRAAEAVRRNAAALEQVLAAVRAAADRLDADTATTLRDAEQLVLATAFDLAEAVVGATLRDDPRRGEHALARALEPLPDAPGDVVVTLHPADRAALAASGAALPAGVRLADDPTLSPGDAVAILDTTTVDARTASALARAREVLAG